MKIEKKHSFSSRWMHWINFPVLTLMIWSGLLIYWSNDVYGIWIFGYELFHFFPKSVYEFTGIDHRLAEGMSIHFFAMWFFAINGFLYVAYTFLSGEWRELVPTKSSFKDAILVVLHDLHLRKELPPQTKYNGAQRIAYSSIILMGAGSVLTGIAIYKPVQFSWLTAIFGGYEWSRWFHFWLTVGYVAFFFIHIAQVVKAGWNNFRSMVSGYAYVEDDSPIIENLSTEQTPVTNDESSTEQTPITKGGKCCLMSENNGSSNTDEPENRELSIAETEEVSPPTIESEEEVSSPTIEPEEELKKQMGRHTRRNFLALGLGAFGLVGSWEWIKNRPEVGGIPSPLRKAHEFNESLAQIFYSPQRLAPTFSVAEAQMPRVNGNEGIDEDFNPAKWKLQVVGIFEPKKYAQYVTDVYYETEEEVEEETTDDSDNSDDTESEAETTEPEVEETPEPIIPGLLLTLDDIKALPRYEMVTELKCIEGWSTKVFWAGARLSDFIEKFAPPNRDGSPPDVKNKPENLVQYVSLQTPDEGYYVGLDLPSAMHPQTLLCYEMNGAPLTLEHGAPLRLVTPLKYGIKHIKRIGRITFTNERPKDFWAEQGYDWYSGH